MNSYLSPECDSLFLHDHLFGGASFYGSVVDPANMSMAASSKAVDMVSSTALSSSTSDLLASDDLWTPFDMSTLPTPPVSPLRNADVHKEMDQDLDLGLGDLLGMDMPGFLNGSDPESQWLFDEIFRESSVEVETAAAAPNRGGGSGSCAASAAGSVKGEIGELRHDCMWAGTCPSEEHRLKKEMTLLSTSPLLGNEPSLLSNSLMAAQTLLSSATQALATVCGKGVRRVERRTRFDTLGSLRPETPLSLSDSEMDTENMMGSPEPRPHSSQSLSSASSSACSSEDESDDELSTPHPFKAQHQAGHNNNIQPVRGHIRKNAAALASAAAKASGAAAAASTVSMTTDHSYSHSDHSYHTQRRPTPASQSASDNTTTSVADLLGIQTPSDSEEEIDVVSLGEVLGAVPTSKTSAAAAPLMSSATSAASVSAAAASAAGGSAPLRLKLKVTAANSGVSSSTTAVLMRKALPSHPSALMRQQLQLAVATAAQQRKQTDQQVQQQQQQQQQQSTRKPEFAKSSLKCSSNSVASVSSSSSSSSHANDSTSGSHTSCSSSGTSKRPRSSNESPGSCSPRKRSSRTGSDSEDSCEKRSQHNSMERQRRVDLRNAFDFLRSLIPDLEATDRAAKVVILKKAAHFCQALTQREKQFIAEKDALQKRQEMLRKRLALLQRRR